MGIHKTDEISRFFRHVTIPLDRNACWIYTGGKRSKSGYGGFMREDQSTESAHVFSYLIHFGPIPDGYSVLHNCDNPPCVNPLHLEAGTQKKNIADCRDRGRLTVSRGSRNGQAKLSEAQATEIIRRYAGGRVRMADLARDFKISITLISMIVNGARWAHLQEIRHAK